MRFIFRGRRNVCWSWSVTFHGRRSTWWNFDRWPEREMLYFSIQNASPRWDEEGLRGGGCEMTILSSDHARIILGLSSNRLSIGGSNSWSFRWNLELADFVAGAVFAEVGGWHCLLCALEMTFHMRRGSNMRFILHGRRSICWGWRLTSLAPRILNDVSYVMRCIFAWQAQYLVRFEVDLACSAHSKWRFICDADQSWDSFCVAGAVFGEGGGWLLLLRAF